MLNEVHRNSFMHSLVSRQVEKTNQFSLENLDISGVKKKTMLFSCDAFSLYKGEHPEAEKILILELSYFSPVMIESVPVISKIRQIMERKKDENPFVLTHIGYHYSRSSNVFSIIYDDKKDLTPFLEENCFSLLEKPELIRLFNIEIIYNIFTIAQLQHENNLGMGLIHPNLLFMNKEGQILTIDSCFFELIFLINKYDNFPICSYFGLYNMDDIEKYEDSFNTRSNDIYKSTDIISLCTIMVYFFRAKPTKASFNYDITLNDFTKCYLLSTEGFTKIRKVLKDEEDIEEVLDCLDMDLTRCSSIEDLRANFIDFANKNKVKCSKCNEEIQEIITTEDAKEKNQINLICFRCGDVICKDCSAKSEHKCNNETLAALVAKNQNEANYIKNTEIYETLPEVKEKKVIANYVRKVDDITNQFQTIGKNTKRLLRKENSFIENLSKYLRQILNENASVLYDNLKEKISQIKYEETSTQVAQTPLSRKTPKTPSSKMNFFSQKSSRSIISVQSAGQIQIKSKITKLNEDIDTFKKYVTDSSELISRLFYDYSIDEICDLLHANLDNLSAKINEDFIASYYSSIEELIKKLKSISNDEKLKEFMSSTAEKKNFSKVIFTIHHEPLRGYFLVKYDLNKGKDPIDGIILKSDGGRELKDDFFQFDFSYRTLHLTSSAIFTKSKTAFEIHFKEAEPNVHYITHLPKMKSSHQNHMMIRHNTFNLIVLGGKNCNTCEVYNFGDENWEFMPNLNYNRSDGCVYLHNDYLLYVFCGVDKDNNSIEAIEVFDMTKFKRGGSWSVIQLNTDLCIKSPITRKLKKEEQDKKVLIYGGENGQKTFYSNCFIIDFDEPKIEKTNESCAEQTFIENQMIEIGENEYYNFANK